MTDFRLAGAGDVPGLVTLINGAYRGEGARAGWTTEADLIDGQRVDARMLGDLTERPDSVILLAGGSDGFIGCVYLERHPQKAYLGMLTVRPDLQRAGLGRKLLAAGEEWVARVWGLPAIEMTVIQKRHELIEWYRRRGYRETGRREPFPYGEERFGRPRFSDLEFVVLAKTL